MKYLIVFLSIFFLTSHTEILAQEDTKDVVTEKMTVSAAFESGKVHAVYSTFALTRDAEWAGRLFVLEMKEADEEGIGTGITVNHHSPALMGQEVIFTATLTEVNKNEVVVDYTAKVSDRLVASGKTWQKILKREKINALFTSLG